MKGLFNKKFKKAASAVCAGAVVIAAALTCAGCNTSHPTVKMVIEFQSTEYELEYKLYRNMYPATVQHFIELADNGYYDGMCVHNYDSTHFYTGAYTYNASDVNNGKGGLEYVDYYSIVKGYSSFTQTVFDLADTTYSTGTYTVYGEFTNNGFSVENNGLKHAYGSLAMYYNDISDICETKVFTRLSSDTSTYVYKDYKFNSATSEFYIFTGTSNSSANAKYCVFGELTDEEPLEDLVTAISDFVTDQQKSNTDYEFTTTYEKIFVDENDAYAPRHYVSYDTPNEEITIKTVTVTGY